VLELSVACQRTTSMGVRRPLLGVVRVRVGDSVQDCTL
jgi:hypothetical protein